MSGRYLTDLADVCRRAGLSVVEQSGWQSRARSSGGYASGRPTHIMCHHDASSPSTTPKSITDYESYHADAAPIANLHLMRDGSVWVLAAGATNTNGSGKDTWGGGVPQDSMNTYAIGIEASNDGVSEPWPSVMQTAYIALVQALMGAYGIPAAHVRDHREWAPTRKVDRAGGPSQWSPNGGQWSVDQFRSDVAGASPAPGPSLEASAMLQMFTVPDGRSPASTFVTNGMSYRVLPTPEAIAAMTVMLASAKMATNVGTLSKSQLAAAGVYVSPEGQIGAANPYV